MKHFDNWKEIFYFNTILFFKTLIMGKEENYFTKLSKIEGEISKKQNLSYISWANAWDMVKREYPTASYTRVRNDLDNSYLFKSWTWGMCEVEVTINWITHSMDLPVLDFRNQPVAYDKIDSFQINKTLMRAFTKAIAMHWIGLYVFKWEDLPNEETDKPRIEKKPEFTKEIFEIMKQKTNFKNYFEAKKSIDAKYNLWLPLAKIVKEYYQNKDTWVELSSDDTLPF